MNRMMTKKGYDELQRYTIEIQDHSYVCNHCGHKSLMSYKVDKTICSWCGSMVYKDSKRYFKDKLRQHLNKKES